MNNNIICEYGRSVKNINGEEKKLINQINDDTTLNGKYKTIGELKNASKRSISMTIGKIDDTKIKNYLLKWAFEKFYSNKFYSSLTNRIKLLNNNICFNHIINHCFNNINLNEYYKSLSILNEECKHIIEKLHFINPCITGVFLDYLIRRIISEIMKENFYDHRAEKYTNIENVITIDNHYCIKTSGTKGCKTKMEFFSYRLKNNNIECEFTLCQNMCYLKTKTQKYKTSDILEEIFITSLCHFEFFNRCISQKDYYQIIDLLRKINKKQFVNTLKKLCKSLCKNSKNILDEQFLEYLELLNNNYNSLKKDFLIKNINYPVFLYNN